MNMQAKELRKRNSDSDSAVCWQCQRQIQEDKVCVQAGQKDKKVVEEEEDQQDYNMNNDAEMMKLFKNDDFSVEAGIKRRSEAGDIVNLNPEHHKVEADV